MQVLAQSNLFARAIETVDRPALAFLRVMAARNRCLGRSDLFEACAALSIDPAQEAEALAQALFSGFSGQGDMPRLRLYQPAADELSFDERWLMSALDAAQRGDTDSLTFLLARRVPNHARRNIAFLLNALGKCLAQQAVQQAA
ncbi:hypothetical protein [Gymnodinialimonas hymeniacidonis]|uniref:hypothetical protein n=1 Tax=Gymnodinialimonas hymeniacidonis TaxID=3126508 RepID=UPI0034C6B888